MAAFPPIAELLPHRDSAVLLDAVLEDEVDAIRARTRIGPNHPYLVPGHGVPVWVGIELMAQAIAAHAGLSARRDHKSPKKGMLLGSRRFEAKVPYFDVGDELEVRATREFGDEGGIAACACGILRGGEILATATLIIVEIPEEMMP
ncbi:MAG TPA: 3-hydroxylacyl-ACP dehydratase [Gammaproteobacteria bacterium]|nr:3-hydroxylacyl-ACP dehydratase [Gammaproteobacteria bacterium]